MLLINWYPIKSTWEKNNLRFESTKTVEFEEFREINISRCKRGCVNEKLDKAEILNLFREQEDHMANNMNHIHRLQWKIENYAESTYNTYRQIFYIIYI